MMPISRAQRRQLERDNAKRPAALTLVPKDEWPHELEPTRLRMWRSRLYLVQEFREEAPALVRLSINIASMQGDRWRDGLGWEALQAIKDEVGYGAYDAVEVYPRMCDVVNVANMRHLWIMAQPLSFAWRDGRST